MLSILHVDRIFMIVFIDCVGVQEYAFATVDAQQWFLRFTQPAFSSANHTTHAFSSAHPSLSAQQTLSARNPLSGQTRQFRRVPVAMVSHLTFSEYIRARSRDNAGNLLPSSHSSEMPKVSTPSSSLSPEQHSLLPFAAELASLRVPLLSLLLHRNNEKGTPKQKQDIKSSEKEVATNVDTAPLLMQDGPKDAPFSIASGLNKPRRSACRILVDSLPLFYPLASQRMKLLWRVLRGDKNRTKSLSAALIRWYVVFPFRMRVSIGRAHV